MSRCHIDQFSGLDDVPKRLHGEEGTVFDVLAETLCASSFEMTDDLWATIQRLVKTGYFEQLDTGYPMFRFRLTAKGKKRRGGDDE